MYDADRIDLGLPSGGTGTVQQDKLVSRAHESLRIVAIPAGFAVINAGKSQHAHGKRLLSKMDTDMIMVASNPILTVDPS